MIKVKFSVFLAMAALVLAACADIGDEGLRSDSAQSDGKVDFSAYMQRSTTRGGTVGEMNTSTLTAAGFGVFAYNHPDETFHARLLPNFMYNQKVTGTTTCTYAPIKYWPNEEGSRLSFFAYAPYTGVLPSTGVVSESERATGITHLSKNTDTGSPLVHYIASTDPAKRVDLCWAVNNTTGLPHIDILKPSTTDKVAFTFKHALSQLNIQVDATVDANTAGTAVGTEADGTVDTNTKIYIRSITLTGFSTKGTLDLNNVSANTPMWLDYSGEGILYSKAVTVYDGRRDGREGYATGAMESETPAGLNPAVVQNSTATTGVTAATVNLFGNTGSKTDPIYVIPNGDQMDVTVEYDVETADPKLIGHYLSDGKTTGTTIENRITKTNVFSMLESGKKYTLNLHLGMNSVKVDATRDDWTDDTKSYNLGERVPLLQGLVGWRAGSDGYAYPPGVSMPEGVINTGMICFKNAQYFAVLARTHHSGYFYDLMTQFESGTNPSYPKLLNTKWSVPSINLVSPFVRGGINEAMLAAAGCTGYSGWCHTKDYYASGRGYVVYIGNGSWGNWGGDNTHRWSWNTRAMWVYQKGQPLSAAQRGWVIGSDGLCYNPQAVMPGDIKPIAMVMYVGTATGVSGYTRGIAMALEDCCDPGVNWETAVDRASAYGVVCAPPADGSSWMLPTKDQLATISTAWGSYSSWMTNNIPNANGTTPDAAWRWAGTWGYRYGSTPLDADDAQAYYWSGTEAGDDAYLFTPSSTVGSENAGVKTATGFYSHQMHARAVFAF